MSRLLKAFFYRMSKDLAFRITLIIGCSIALILSVILLVADLMMDMEGIKLLTGHGMLTMSLNPAQNYGIAIPINVAIFVALEFTQGTIRNKIIAGHSKLKIYASLYISGLILGTALLFAYVGFLTIFGTIFGGFDVNVVTILGTGFGAATVEYIVKFVILALLAYTTLISYSVFIATVFRSLGPSIPLVFAAVYGLYFIAMIVSVIVSVNKEFMNGCEAALAMAQDYGDADTIAEAAKEVADFKPTYDTVQAIGNVFKCINPLYGLSATESVIVGEGEDMKAIATMDDFTFYSGIASNLAYSAAFFFGGACLFKKRDVK